MSSILRALKKIENQAADQDQFRFSQPKNHILKDGHEQIYGRLRVNKRYVIIFVGLVFIVGAGLVLGQKFHERTPKLVAKKVAVGVKSARLPEKRVIMPDKKSIQQKPVRVPEKKTVRPDRVQKELSSQKDDRKFGPIVKAVPPSSHQSPKSIDVLSNTKTSTLKQAQKERVAENSDKKSEQNTKSDPYASMPVKRSNQTNIEVQAIAWANDPKSRLAVVNGLILRERESIDNVIVMHIGKDAIVFKKGTEEWKQMFGF